MASDKNVLTVALMAHNEATYGAAVTMNTGTDCIHLAELPELEIAYAFDGARSPAAFGHGNQARLTPSGRTGTMTVKIEGKGLGSTYTTASVPPNLHAFLLASGLSGSATASGYLYQPTTIIGTPSSLAMEVYSRGEKRTVTNAYTDMKFAADSTGPVIFEFPVQGLCGVPVVANPPSVGFTATSVIPPNAAGVTLALGSWATAKVRSFSFELGREIGPRMDLASAGGHAGFAPGRRAPKLTVSVEATALTTYDPYTAFASASLHAVSLTVGSVALNRFRFTAPQAQLMSVTDGADGSVATWDLEFDCPLAFPQGIDDFSLFFN